MPQTPRSSARYRKRFKVQVSNVAAFTIDVSLGGFCTELMQVLPVGTDVQGKLFVHGSEVPFSGKVAWMRPGNSRMNVRGRMGVRFAQPPREIESALALLR